MALKEKAAIALSTTLGSGFFPFAPGTVGALIAVVLLWFLQPIMGWLWIVSVAASFVVGVKAAQISDTCWRTEDSGRINWDEVVGMMISVFAIPNNPWLWVSAFFLFRFFDIIKPFPVRQAEKLPHGWGVMTDDALAGVYSNLCLQVMIRFIL